MTTATTGTKTNPPVKSQAMDDVLEILIRSGGKNPLYITCAVKIMNSFVA